MSKKKISKLLDRYIYIKADIENGGSLHLIDDIIDLERSIKKAELTQRQLRILNLYYYYGYTQEEIATDLDVYRSTVSRQLNLVINKITEAYYGGNTD